MNLNKLAVEITEEEGLIEELNIAQIKEVLRITLHKLKEYTLEDIAVLLKRIK